jgi:hypothetical protein
VEAVSTWSILNRDVEYAGLYLAMSLPMRIWPNWPNALLMFFGKLVCRFGRKYTVLATAISLTPWKSYAQTAESRKKLLESVLYSLKLSLPA